MRAQAGAAYELSMHLAAVLAALPGTGALGLSCYRLEHLISATRAEFSARTTSAKRCFWRSRNLISAMRGLSAQTVPVKRCL
jgi:hypothetical protein